VNDIRWLDGKNSNGKFILEMLFSNGGTGYLKNDSYEAISKHYEVLWDSPEVVSMTLYHPNGKVVAAKNKPGVAA
jgi:hypothetical protein